jgi:hypothetical protein
MSMPLRSGSVRHAQRVVTAGVLGAILVLTACADDRGTDDSATGDSATDDSATDDTATTSDEGGASDDATSTTGMPADDQVVEVELADFAFEGLPDTVPVGTRLAVTNSSTVELHKLSALPLPDDEVRPVEELIALPGRELAAILRVRPATVLVAGPGGPQVNEVGDGTLSEPGRYLLICAVPIGLDPDEYLDALEGDGRRPQVTGEGDPHFKHGMVADIVVE